MQIRASPSKIEHPQVESCPAEPPGGHGRFKQVEDVTGDGIRGFVVKDQEWVQVIDGAIVLEVLP